MVWLYFNGAYPKQTDHINHNKLDNRIENLREVTPLENQRNMSLYSTNNSGFNGVRYNKQNKRWIVNAKLHGIQTYFGSFNDILEAISMRLTINDNYGFHRNHGENR